MRKHATKRILILALTLLLTVAALCVGVWAADDEVDAMDAILADATLAQYKVDTYALADDGYLGIPVDFTYYYDATKGAAKPGIGNTTLIMYVVNTKTERSGTDTDVEIITSMVERGYIVAVADYHNHEKTTADDVEWSTTHVIQSLMNGKYFTNTSVLTVGYYNETLMVPAGHNVTRDLVFWELDKHSVDGSLDTIVAVWNADFRSSKGAKYVIPWVYEDGTRKPTQAGFDGSEPVWYSLGTGAGAVTVNGVSYVPDAENGTYVYIKHTKATKVSDCVKADGSPIDLNLYMHVVYPTNPENDVPVLTLASSSQGLATGATQIGRPHLWGFAFEGYAVAMYDYAYVPMARTDHYDYFDGSSSFGGVTGDMMTYSLYTYNMALAPTAALRYLRYLGLSEHDTYRFDGNVGVIGNSKASNITQLADLDLQHVKTTADGYTSETLLDYANEYVCSFPPH